MIIKSFELNKINYKHKFFLLYGENEGHKNQVIKEKFKKNYTESIYLYEEIKKDFLIQFYQNHFLKKKN